MKIAIISDIHGNMQALERVLNDIKAEKCEKIFCLGDLAMAGPEPVKAIELIKSLYEAGELELIQGNTDEIIANITPEFIEEFQTIFPIMAAAAQDDAKIIPSGLLDFLRNLPEQKTIDVEGVKVLLVHGSPRKNNENIFPDLEIEKVEEMVEGTDADIIFCGHTHLPCGYQTSKKQTIVNVGSVGRPFTPNPQACYAIVEFASGSYDVMHKLLDYDNQKASDILKTRTFQGAPELAKMLINPEFRHI